jgi:hypothetical protein
MIFWNLQRQKKITWTEIFFLFADTTKNARNELANVALCRSSNLYGISNDMPEDKFAGK